MFGSSFIQDSWIGNKILANLLAACNYTTYSTGIVPFDGDVPATGDIYIGGDLIGYRDPVTFVFTPEPLGFERPWDSIVTTAFNFEDSTTDIDTYIGSLETATPAVGPDYGGTTVKGNKSITRPHMSIAFETPGTEISWTGKHICYPYSQKPSAGRTLYNWNTSANKGYFDLRGNWSFECGIENTGPQDETEYSTAGAPTQEQLLQAQSDPSQIYSDSICSIYNDEIGFNTQLPTLYVNGVACTWPAAALEKITKYKMFVSYEYQSGLTKGVVTISLLSKTDGLLHIQTTDIPAPPAISATEDIKLCGGYDGASYVASAYKGLSNFVYYDNYLLDLGALENSYMLNYDFYYLSPLFLGDSWTKTHNLDVDVNGYTNKFLELAVTDGYKNTGVIIKYTPDYHYTSPAVTDVPPWGGNYGHLPGVGDLDDFTYMVDYWYLPTAVMLAYTGINHGLLHPTAKTGNPDWGDVPWSSPIYYCQKHIDLLENRGTKWVTWDSAPCDLMLDVVPSQTDQIGRVEDPLYAWNKFFLSSSVFGQYAITNDPANNGDILPAIALGDGAHILENGYLLVGQGLYDGFKQALVPEFISTDVVNISSPIDAVKTNEYPIPTTWTNSLGDTINDHEIVVESEFATDVTINRGFNFNTDSITVSLKTGIPIPLLKSYYTDLDVEVDFLGVYEVPDTVASPVKFGWTITNGNVPSEVVQTTFTQAMTVDEINVVTMPSFTDDWGNEIPAPSLDTNIAYGNVQTNYLQAVQVGNALSVGHQTGNAVAKLSATRVALASGGNDFLQAYSWDGTDYVAMGNQLAIGAIFDTGMTYLSDNRIAFFDSSTDFLKVYDFDGTDFTQVGNALQILGINSGICRLDANTIALADIGGRLWTWAFDGTDWAQVGNMLNIGSMNAPKLATIGVDRVVLTDTGNMIISVYDWDGSDWTLSGNSLAKSMGANSIATLNSTDFAFIDSTNDELEPYRFDETDLSIVGVTLPLSVSNVSIAAINDSDIVLYDTNSDALRTYRFTKE
jgi:hypothetical protein